MNNESNSNEENNIPQNPEEHKNSQELWGRFKFYSEKLSDNSRQLAFAAVAIIWALKIPNSSDSLPTILLLGLLFSVFFFISDIVQYLAGSLISRNLALACDKKKKNKPNEKFIQRKGTHTTTYCFFYVKIILLGIIYLLIIMHVFKTLCC